MTHTGKRQSLPRTAGPALSGRELVIITPSRAFTLLELLVTVGMISVLALMAMPHYEQAHIRSKIAASKNNIRLIRNAMEVYRLDQGGYPEPVIISKTDDPYGVIAKLSLMGLTTPIAYVSSAALRDSFGLIEAQGEPPQVVEDPFRPPEPDDFASPEPQFNKSQSLLYFYYPRLSETVNSAAMRRECYAIVSVGPDRKDSFIVYYPFPQSLPVSAAQYGILHVEDTVYDPSNGTQSGGDVAGFGPEANTPLIVGGGGQ